jgi:anti-sigma B factor antagonist
MSLGIAESTREDIVILALSGKLTFRESDGVLEKIQSLGAAGRWKVILDLSRLYYLDSTGLGAIVGGYTSLTKLGGALKLVNPNQRNLHLLLMTQLHTLFEIFSGVRDAVDSFFPERKAKHLDFSGLINSAAGGSAGE